MKIFEASYLILGKINHEGEEYKYEADITYVEGGGNDYLIEIIERGINSDLEEELEELIRTELEKYELKFEEKMTITEKEEIIFNDKDGNTQCISKKELKEAWELYKNKELLIKFDENYNEGKHVFSSCVNYERDNIDDSIKKKKYTNDLIVNEAIDKFIERSKKNEEKYGVNLNRTDYKLEDWLREASEEAYDMGLYLDKARKMIIETRSIIKEEPNDEILGKKLRMIYEY